MKGADFAAERVRRGYTQAALAQVLNVSAPSVARMEAAHQVPAEHVQVLLSLPPAPSGGRGPYKAGKATSTAKRAPPPTPLRERTMAARPKAPAPPPQVPEAVHEADAIGAMLLEEPTPGSSLWGYWLRVVVQREVVLSRVRRRGPPCR